MPVKVKRTFYTDEKIAAALKNISKYDWARELRDRTVEKADKFLSYGHDMLWELVTSQKLPRSYGVNQTLGCPVCGKAIDKYGNYPYVSDPVENPWKVICPSCKTVFPTNDFGAYYKSGLDEKGCFNPDAADRSLLKNELYPEKGESWCVDDGYGWVDPENDNDETKRYTFIAYYNHWQIWDGYENTKLSITGMLSVLSRAYLFTGDKRYATACTIVLDRVADVYPDMDSTVYRWSDGFRNSHGMSGIGGVIGSIWETGLVKQIMAAYDAIYDAIDQPEAVDFIKAKKLQYPGLKDVKSIEQIKDNFENGFLRQIFPGVKSLKIHGNVGMHQSSLLLAAVILQDENLLREVLVYLFESDARTRYRGKENVLHILVDDVDRDGHGNEASPGYNSIWMNCIKLVADILAECGNNKYDLYNNVKFRKLFHMVHPLVVLDNYTPSIGDTKKAGDPGIICDLQSHATSFYKTGDVKVGQIVYLANGNKVEGICKDIFSDCEAIENKLSEVIKQYGPLENTSTNITGYGYAALRAGEDDRKHALMLYYGRNTGHGHRDTLNLNVYAFGADLTPDHGYPCFADSNLERRVWTINTVSHNTVTVDRKAQNNNVVGIPHHYDGLSDVMLIDVEAPAPYPETSMYRRTSAMIRVDSSNSYIVDLFRVKGGGEHLFSFHGGEGDISVEGLNLEVQGQGTYAGKSIRFADQDYSRTQPDGFNHLYNVSRDNSPASKFSVDWAVKDTWKVQSVTGEMHLRLTMLNNCDDIAIADGEPPQNKPGNPKSYKYLLAHRQGDGLASQFVSIIEPYMEKSFIKDIQALELYADGKRVSDETAAAVKVTLENGRTDYIINSIDSGAVYQIDGNIRFSGFMGVCSVKGGKPVYAYVNDGTLLEFEGNKLIDSKTGSLKGKVIAFTKDLALKNEILVEFDTFDETINFKGKYIYIKNDGVKNAVYKLEGAQKLSEGKYLLDVGDITFIRQLADTGDISKGYIYEVEAGMEAHIPVSRTWREE